MIKAIVFDFAGVVMSEGYWLWLGENIPNLESKKDYFLSISHKVDKGDITSEEFLAKLAEASHKTNDKVWEEMNELFKVNSEMINLIESLKKSYRVTLLSNFPHEWMTYLLKKYDLRKHFEVLVISSEHRVIKPEPEIFNLMLDNLKLRPEETVFIDDREVNIKGAEAVGMKGIVYSTDEKLRKDLHALEIII
jgi:epoxide hydrolase-like predicted phosphatase